MQVQLGGVNFDVDDATSISTYALLDYRTVAEVRTQQVYFWVCPNGPGRKLVRMTAANEATLHNILHFHERAPGTILDQRNKGLSTRMQRAMLRETSATKINNLMSDLQRRFGLPKMAVPIAKFAWLNPVVTYMIVMDIDYLCYEAEATINKPDPTPDVTLRCYILLPHKVRFTYEVIDYCNAGEYERLIGLPAHDEEQEEAFLVKPLNRRNKDLRSQTLRRRIRFLLRELETGFMMSEAGRARRQRELEEAQRDLRELQAS